MYKTSKIKLLTLLDLPNGMLAIDSCNKVLFHRSATNDKSLRLRTKKVVPKTVSLLCLFVFNLKRLDIHILSKIRTSIFVTEIK